MSDNDIFTTDDIAGLLLREAARINTPEFIPDDPVQFPRKFSDLRDIEIAAILISHISWGRRAMILQNAGRLLDMMDNQPYHYLMDGAWKEIPDSCNIHRTFFGSHLKSFLAGLHRIYDSATTLQDWAADKGANLDEFPCWRLAELMRHEICIANKGSNCERTIPANLSSTALKRLNMAMRWLVRRDGIVDMGVWEKFSPARLFIPLDVHVGNTSRALGLTSRRANDRKTAIEITEALRHINPGDPILLDFALFGIGIESPGE